MTGHDHQHCHNITEQRCTGSRISTSAVVTLWPGGVVVMAAVASDLRSKDRAVSEPCRGIAGDARTLYIGWSDVTESVATIRSPFYGVWHNVWS